MKRKLVKYGAPIIDFGEIWKGIVSRTLEGASHRALTEAFTIALTAFAKFRTSVDLESKMFAGEFSARDLRALGMAYIDLLRDIEKAFDRLFLQTATESASVIYRHNLENLRLILLNLLDGDAGAFNALKPRTNEDRTTVRAVKDQVARAYKFLKDHGANRQEAVDELQKMLKSHAACWNLTPAFTFGYEALEKRCKTTGALDPELERRALAMLPNSAKRPLSRTSERNEATRRSSIGSIVTLLLSGHVSLLDWSEIIPSTVDTKLGAPPGRIAPSQPTWFLDVTVAVPARTPASGRNVGRPTGRDHKT